jgi:biopolymer transport protein ExbD
MTDIRHKYPQNKDVTVIPSDDVSYADIVHVLERLKKSSYEGISLSTRARSSAAAGR